MDNKTVIKSFLKRKKAQTALRDIACGYGTYKGRTLTSDGTTLINYSTVIAHFTPWRGVIYKRHKI